jgi:uncharacterized delta-60 repeat protein
MRRAFTFAVLTLAGGLTGLAAPPSKPGGLDSTFGTKGIVTTDFGGGTVDAASAVAIDPVTGQAVAAGNTCISAGYCPFALARYNLDGSLDANFGTNGLVTQSFSASETDYATAVSIDESGNIYVAGSTCPAFIGTSTGHCEFALARYNSDGTPDTNFGADGWVVTDVAGMIDPTNTTGPYANGTAIAIYPSVNPTTIAVAGETTYGGTGSTEFAVLTYDLTGTLVTPFGGNGNGIATTSLGSGSSSSPVGVAFDSAGNIIAAGRYSDGSGNNQIGLACYQSDGTVCPGFTSTDLTLTGGVSPGGMEINSSGQITVAGTSSGNFVVARYNADGTLDSTFNSTGVVTTSFGKNKSVTGNAVAENANGEIAVVGSTGSAFAVAAYNADGSSAWTTTTVLGHGKNINSSATGVAIDPSTLNITAAGYTNATSGGDNDFALARYIP